jgi:hypothetical protein
MKPIKVHWLDWLDRLGAFLSGACAAHCICMPVLLAILPSWGVAILAGPWVERGAVVVMVVLAAACLWAGCRRHGRWALFALFGTGVAIVAGLIITREGRGGDVEISHGTEAFAMAVGGLLIATSHVLNLRLRRGCRWAECRDDRKPRTTQHS